MSIFEKMVEKDPVKYPARMGKKWDIEEVDKLLVSIQNKKSILEIAAEHQRTTGGINSELRKIAANYWFINKKTIEEICEITSLTKEEIELTIKRRTISNKSENRRWRKEKIEVSLDNKEIVSILKDIQSKLSLLIENFK